MIWECDGGVFGLVWNESVVGLIDGFLVMVVVMSLVTW